MTTPDDVRRLQAQRFAYLNYLYEDWRKLKSPQTVPGSDVDSALGLTEQEGDRAQTYLEDAGLIEFIASGPLLAITRRGIDLVEEALASPDQRTEYFPPINILHIETVTNSQIQQGTSRGPQEGQWNGIAAHELVELIDHLKAAFSSPTLSAEQRQDVDASIATLEAQTRASKPNHAIVHETLKSLRSIAESVGASLIASRLAAVLFDVML